MGALPVQSTDDEITRVSFRLLTIGARRYSAEPASRPGIVTVILVNALRLCVRHIGRKQTASVVLQTLSDGPDAC